jgi:cytoskeletal protein CcmA (bactofilin family)
MRRVLVLALVVVLIVPAFTGVAAAQSDQRFGGAVVVEEGETVDGFTAYGGTVVVRGTVEGDLTAFAGRVVVDEGGTVTGRLRAFAGSVEVAGSLGDNAVATAGAVTVTDSATISGSLGVVGGNLDLGGTVRGDATAGTGAVTVRSSAFVDGFLIYAGAIDDEGGTIVKDARNVSDLSLLPSISGAAAVLVGLYLLVADLFAGVLLLRAFPDFADDALETTLEQPQRLGLAGLLTAVGVPIGIALAAITIVGIPLALAGALGFVVLLWVGSIYGRYLVGASILSFTDRENPYLALLVGVLLLAILTLVPILGPAIQTVVVLFGVGAVALGLLVAFQLVQEKRAGPSSGQL